MLLKFYLVNDENYLSEFKSKEVDFTFRSIQKQNDYLKSSKEEEVWIGVDETVPSENNRLVKKFTLTFLFQPMMMYEEHN